MRTNNSIIAIALFLIGLPALLLASVEPANAQVFGVGPPSVVLSLQNMEKDNVYFPDGAIGVISTGLGGYFIFGAGGSFGGIGPGPAIVPSGTYLFYGTLANFSPLRKAGGNPIPSLQWGRTQPSPFGEHFDRDYAGGGPTYLYVLDGGVKLLQLYHGEYHPNYPASLPFYGGEGMAVSNNGGDSFTKIGQFIAPRVTLEEMIASGQQQAGIPTDGFMIEADIGGNRIVTPYPNNDHVYCYFIFTDRQSMATPQGFAIARVQKQVLLDAISVNQVPPFQKFYNGRFSQPSLGGSSTFVVEQGRDAIAWPQPIYSTYLHQFLLFYQTNQESVQVRSSTNLMTWSEPATLYKNTDPAVKLYYPTAVGAEGDPQVLGQNFFIYFQKRYVTGQLRPNYYRVPVSSLRTIESAHGAR